MFRDLSGVTAEQRGCAVREQAVRMRRKNIPSRGSLAWLMDNKEVRMAGMECARDRVGEEAAGGSVLK